MWKCFLHVIHVSDDAFATHTIMNSSVRSVVETLTLALSAQQIDLFASHAAKIRIHVGQASFTFKERPPCISLLVEPLV